MEPQEMADAVEQIAALAVELVKQIATPIYAASLNKVIVTSQIGLTVCTVVGGMLLGLAMLCAWQGTKLDKIVKESKRNDDPPYSWNSTQDKSAWWALGFFCMLICEIPVIFIGASHYIHLRAADYWALLLVRDMLIGK